MFLPKKSNKKLEISVCQSSQNLVSKDLPLVPTTFHSFRRENAVPTQPYHHLQIAVSGFLDGVV